MELSAAHTHNENAEWIIGEGGEVVKIRELQQDST